MAVKDKQWALNQLRHTKNAFVLSLASMRLLNSESIDLLKGGIVVLKNDSVIWNSNAADRVGRRIEIPLDQIVATRNSDFQQDLAMFLRSNQRAFLKESFEICRAYSENNPTSLRMTTLPWFNYVRLIRNSISHGFVWIFNKKDKSILPVSYKGKEITFDLEGKEITWEYLYPEDLINFWFEMADYVGQS